MVVNGALSWGSAGNGSADSALTSLRRSITCLHAVLSGEGNDKGRTISLVSVHGNDAVEQGYEPLRNGESEPRPAERARRPGIELRKWLEDSLAVSRANAGTG